MEEMILDQRLDRVLVALPAAVLCLLGGVSSLPAEDQVTPFRVAAVQFRSSLRIEDNAARMSEMLARLSDDGVQVAVFPECALTRYDRKLILKASAEDIAEAEEQIRRTCRERRR